MRSKIPTLDSKSAKLILYILNLNVMLKSTSWFAHSKDDECMECIQAALHVAGNLP